jgi:hypothetical protein
MPTGAQWNYGWTASGEAGGGGLVGIWLEALPSAGLSDRLWVWGHVLKRFERCFFGRAKGRSRGAFVCEVFIVTDAVMRTSKSVPTEMCQRFLAEHFHP